VAGPRRHSTWSGTTSVAAPRGPAGVQITRASGPKGPGARLGRWSHWRLGSGEGRVQVGSYLGHDLLGAADPRLPAAFAAGAALAALGSGRGPDGDLVPGDLLVDGDGHGHLRSVGYGRTYPLGKPVTNLPAGVPGMRSVAVALVTPRYAPVPIAALAGVPRPGHCGPQGRCEAEGQPSAAEKSRAAGTYSLLLNSVLGRSGSSLAGFANQAAYCPRNRPRNRCFIPVCAARPIRRESSLSVRSKSHLGGTS
jgi:hypothetical protein